MKLFKRAFITGILLFMILSTCGGFVLSENDDNGLFPIYGVTLGKTSTDELAQLGRKSDQYDYYIINSLKFWFQNNVASSVQITKYDSCPEEWRKLGFDWSLTYNEWISLLRKQGYQVQIKEFPIVKIYDYKDINTYNPYLTFSAQFNAFKGSAYPTVLNFYFNFGKGTTPDSIGTLYSITASFKPNTTQLLEQDFYESKEQISLPDNKRKELAYSGILTELNHGYHESLAMFEDTPEIVRRSKDLILRDWGIKDREDLLKTLESLDKQGHSSSYQEIIKILDENPGLNEEELAFKYHFDDYIVKRLFFVRKMRKVIGNRSLRAWDYSRMIFLCREGYGIGFLSEKEAWTWIDKIASKIEKTYYSWEDLGANYIIGRMFWATANNNEIEMGNDASTAMSRLFYTQNIIWNLPWSNGKSIPKNGVKPTTIEDALYCPSKEHLAWEHFTEGNNLLAKKLPDKAITEFNTALKLNPAFYHVYFNRGNAFFNSKDYRKAINDYQVFLKYVPNDYYASLNIAKAFDNNNQPDEALTHYQQVVALDPKNPDGFIDLGRFYFNQKQYQDAILTFEKSENLLTDTLQPGNNTQTNKSLNNTMYLLGASYFNLHFYDQALSYFLRGYEYYKTWGEYNYYIGICYLNKSKPENDQAVEFFKKAELQGVKLPQEIVDLIKKTDQSR